MMKTFIKTTIKIVIIEIIISIIAGGYYCSNTGIEYWKHLIAINISVVIAILIIYGIAKLIYLHEYIDDN